LDGTKEFERATMTRIGRCQIKADTLLAMLPRGETISPRSKSSRPNCADRYQCADGRSAVTQQGLIHKLSFKIA
jgi:hypothetical protein